MTDQATSQSDNIVPPRLSKVCAITVDGTSRAYDLRLLALGVAFRTAADNDYIYVDMVNDGAVTIYYAFSNATGTVDDTVVNAAAAAPLVFGATMAQSIPAGGFRSERVQRNVDQWLMLKCAGAGTSTLRMNASSQPSAAALR